MGGATVGGIAVAVGGTGVFVAGGSGVLVGGTTVRVARGGRPGRLRVAVGRAVLVGGWNVAVGGTGVFVGGRIVAVGRMGVYVGGICVLVEETCVVGAPVGGTGVKDAAGRIPGGLIVVACIPFGTVGFGMIGVLVGM